MGSGAFLVAACRYLAACHRTRARRNAASGPADGDVVERRVAPAADCRAALSVRRRSQPDGRAARAVVAVAHDAGERSSADLSRSSPRDRRQPARRRLRELARNPIRASGVARPADPIAALPLFADQTPPMQLARQSLPERFRLAVEPGDTPRAVREKERALDALNVAGTPPQPLEAGRRSLVRGLVSWQRG